MTNSNNLHGTTNGVQHDAKAASVINDSKIPLIIGGKDIVGSATFPVINPANGQELWTAGGASVKEAIQAVDAAEAAFPAWSRTKPSVRRDIFLRASELFREYIDELTDYQKLETAADPNFVKWILGLTVDNLKEWAGKTPFVAGGFPPSEDEGRGAIILKEPYGVVLGIAPWNAPWPLGCRAVAPALAAGNTCVLKGPELSPRCYHAIVSIFRQAGLPDGVLNLVFHTMHHHPFATPTLSPGEKKKPPHKLNDFNYTQLHQNKRFL